MNEPESKPTNGSEVAELKAQCAALSRQVTRLLLGLVVVSLVVTGYLALISRRAGRDLRMMRPQATQMSQANAKEAPVLQEFMARLADYGRTHPAFQPIVTKYGLKTNVESTVQPVGAVQPVGGTTPPAKTEPAK